MRMTKRIVASFEGIKFEDAPIPPVNLNENEVIIELDRLLLSPYDYLLSRGLIESEFPRILGSLGSGRVLEQASIETPSYAAIYPRSCRDLPVIGRGGIGYLHLTFRKGGLAGTPPNLKHPEFLFIYDSIIRMSEEAVPPTLVIGSDGLQTLLLSEILEDAVFTGVKALRRIKENHKVISAENLESSEWNSIIVNTSRYSVLSKTLVKLKAKKIIVNPFVYCFIGSLPNIASTNYKIVVSFPLVEGTIPFASYNRLEKELEQSGMFEEASIEEFLTNPILYHNKYLTIKFGNGWK